MKLNRTFLTLALASGAFALPAKTSVEWSTLGNELATDGTPQYVQRFEIKADQPFARIAFNQFARKMHVVNPSDTLIEIVPGYYCVASPRFASTKPGETIIVDVATSATLNSICYSVDGVHLVLADGSTRAVEFSRKDITAERKLWVSPSGEDVMPYGDTVYDRNEELRADLEHSNFYDVIPSYKKVTLSGGKCGRITSVRYVDATNPQHAEWYRATIADGTLTLETAPNNREAAMRRLAPLNLELAMSVPEAVVEDYPDFSYRGMMIDISRNYQTPAEMERVLHMMARYGLNVLHFHFADDESWRLDIPGMPELVEVGGRRGYTLTETDHLAQIFTGDGNPASLNTSNGYFTREDFIGMLRVAQSLGIKVLPEIESPGHARAAILAMEKRLRDTGDATYRLIDPDDKSIYTSAQSFHDNVMNPAIPGPVRFMTYVVAEIQKMYADAGVELPAIHIGGDEVADGAWKGSPIAQKYMKDHGITNERDLHLVFIREIVKNFSEMGIRISGWQEIAVGHSDEFNKAVRPNVFSVDCWSTLGEQNSVTMQSARSGYPTVLSNVNHFYMDMCYSPHPYERGLSWGGYVDEFDSLHGYAAVLCPVEPEAAKNIIGIGGHLFSETIRSAENLEEMLLPKTLGLAERAWNADTTYTDAAFNAVLGFREIPWLQLGDYKFHVRQPGIKMVDGKVVMNTSYPASLAPEIRYTLDGSEPTRASLLYQGPIDAGSATQIRARAFVGTRQSVVSLLFK